MAAPPGSSLPVIPSIFDDDELDALSNQFRLKVAITAGEKIVTENHSEFAVPNWGGRMQLQGNRDYRHIFRLPNKGGWIQKWVYSRVEPTEYVPECAVDNSTAESTTLFRQQAGMAIPMMSSHWFLCPCQSLNGYTIGLAYMDITLNKLDQYCVGPQPIGRFVMDEESGEVFMTAWSNESKCMTIAWTQSVSSCERVREVLLFEASKFNGEPPGRCLLQNSFYERRDCKLCSVHSNYQENTIPPCRAPAASAKTISKANPSDYIFPLQTAYRRFRGCFFGVAVKTVHNYGITTGCTPGANSFELNYNSRIEAIVPIVCDIRHGVASVTRRLRLNLRSSAITFGMGPRVTSRFLGLDARRYITANVPDGTSDIEQRSNGNGNHSSNDSTSTDSRGNCTDKETKRRRNADTIFDRNTIGHQRKVRNRLSAQKTNKARKERIDRNKAELEDLKTNNINMTNINSNGNANGNMNADVPRTNILLDDWNAEGLTLPANSISNSQSFAGVFNEDVDKFLR